MSRLSRKTNIHAQIESTYGENPGSWAASHTLLVSNPRHRIARDVVPRELVRDYLGGSDHLIGTRRAEIEYDVELAGSGTAGDPPAYGPLLRACGFAETISAGSDVAYTLVSEGFESVMQRYIIDGVMYTSRGGRGTVKLDLTAYQRPMLKFKFWGYDSWGQEKDAVGVDYSAWKRPQVVTDANSGEIRLGGTQTGNGNVTGGSVLASRGLEIDLGNTLSHVKLLGGEAIDIIERDSMGKMSVALSAADEVTWRTDITNNVVTSLGFNHGTGAGNRIVVYAPKVQRIDPQAETYEGRHLMSTELRLLPDAGNDELTIVVK